MKLQLKLLLSTSSLSILFSVVCCLILGGITLAESEKLLLKNAENRLTASRNQVAKQVESYFNVIRSQVSTSAKNLMYIDAMEQFTDAFTRQVVTDNDHSSLTRFYQSQFEQKFKSLNPADNLSVMSLLSSLSDKEKSLQRAFIADNPSALGQKDELTSLNDGSYYADVHAKYHESIRAFQREFGFYDVFLVEPQNGNIVYSVFKEIDYATSLLHGPFAKSAIAEAFRQSLATKSTYLTDFSAYLPSYNAQAAFIATPIMKQDRIIGVLIFQLPIDRLNNIMTHNKNWIDSGFGDSGETYLIGHDGLMRSDARFLIEDPTAYYNTMKNVGLPESVIQKMKTNVTSMGLQPVNTIGAERIKKGETGIAIFNDYRNVSVVSAYQPLKVEGLNWGVLSEIDEEEALRLVTLLEQKMLMSLIVLSIAALIIGSFAGWVLATTITSPLRTMLDTVNQLSSGKGDLRIRLPVSGSDELATLATGVNKFIDYLDNTFSSLMASIIRMQPMSEDVKDINAHLIEYANNTQEQSVHVQQQLTDSLSSSRVVDTELANIKTAATHASQEVSVGRTTVATTVKQMLALQQDISSAAEAVNLLEQNANEIVRIVDVIKTIAEQTNLLALNASIEAARAGDMGRGFAVVADEVRGLASRTQESTNDVATMINNITKSTGQVAIIMKQSLESTRECAVNVNKTESSWGDIESAMQTIEKYVQTIDVAIQGQLHSLSGVSDNFNNMDTSFENTRQSIELCDHVSIDITKLGARLRELTDSFEVTNDEYSTKRRKMIRKEDEM
ncbi:methyl-accepting chemotaxis protein [Shewanella sp.]|uniref:methyl-accepting chemotaxis protein n=1 Tax=Shewanella sp. TaxID=50422 RepID=UPI004048AB96